MSCIGSRAFILFTDAKDKRSTCNFLQNIIVVKSPQQKTKIYLQVFFLFLIYVEKAPFPSVLLIINQFH